MRVYSRNILINPIDSDCASVPIPENMHKELHALGCRRTKHIKREAFLGAANLHEMLAAAYIQGMTDISHALQQTGA